MKHPIRAEAERDNQGDGRLFDRLNYLTRLSKDLSSEHNIDRLLETILNAAQNITNADGGTLYRVIPGKELVFEIVRTDSLGVVMGGTSGVPVPIAPLAVVRFCRLSESFQRRVICGIERRNG